MAKPASPKPPTPRTDAVSLAEREIRKGIEQGKWRPGEILPSVRSLAEHLETSEPTARKAVDTLRLVGVLTDRPGSHGVQVPSVTDRLAIVRDMSEWAPIEKRRALITDPVERGSYGASERHHNAATADLDFEATYTPMDLDERLAERFEMEVGSMALKRHYITRWKETGVASGVSDSWLLMIDIDGHLPLTDASEEPWPGATMHQLRQVGIEVEEVESTTTARPATLAEVEEMMLPEYSWVLAIEKRLRDTRGLVVEVADIVLDARVATTAETVKLPAWPVSHNDEPDATIRANRRGR